MHDIALNLVVIRATDLAESVRFYRALGLELVSEQHGAGPRHYACTLGETVFELYPCIDSESSVATRLGFRVPSVDRAVESARRLGASIPSLPRESPWGRRAVVADPDGHRVELIEKPSA